MTFPLNVTEAAVKQMIAARAAEGEAMKDVAIRAYVKGGGCSGFSRGLDLEDAIEEEDLIQEYTMDNQTIKVVIDDASAVYLEGTTLDFVETELQSGFKFSDGSIKSTCACGSSVAY